MVEVKLTKCEKMVYETLLFDAKSEGETRLLTAKEITKLVNVFCGTKWPVKTVRNFLERMVAEKCARKEKRKLKWHYEVIENKYVSNKIKTGTYTGRGNPLVASLDQ